MDFAGGEILYINKPLGWTSFDVVNKIRIMLRNLLGIRKIKVGHAGTLDPLATGGGVVCTGKATKRIEELMGHDKEYVATIRLGQTTPSFDLETQPDAVYPTDHIDLGLVERTIRERFTGRIEQVPPMFSAIKIDGKRAYEYARRGNSDVELKSRPVTIHSISVERFELPMLTVRISCSKGTYIRSLARDLGRALGSGAHLTALERTAVGTAGIDRALTLTDLETMIARMPRPAEQAETA